MRPILLQNKLLKQNQRANLQTIAVTITIITPQLTKIIKFNPLLG